MHVRRGLCRRFEEKQSSFARVCLGISRWDRSLVRALVDEVELVTREGNHDVLICLALQFLHPRLGFIQRRLFKINPISIFPLYLYISKDEERKEKGSYSLGDVINHNGAVGVSIVHGSQRLVSLLAGGIPDFELDCRVFVQRDGLCQEGGANRRLSVVIKLILIHVNMDIPSPKFPTSLNIFRSLTLTNLRTSELWKSSIHVSYCNNSGR